MGDISDIEELLSAYRREEKRGRNRPAIWGFITLLGTAGGAGFSGHAYLSRLPTQEQMAAVETRLKAMEEKLDEMKSSQRASDMDQNLRLSDAQMCCDHVSMAVSKYLYPGRQRRE